MNITRIPWTESHYAEAREFIAREFAENHLGTVNEWESVQGAASPRRFFRCLADTNSYIVMDSPLPPRHGAYIFLNDFQVSPESVRLFANRADLFLKRQLPVPKVFARDDEQGFLLLEDFGDSWLWYELHTFAESSQKIIQALDLLGWWQRQTRDLSEAIPLYDATFLRAEVNLFADYFLPFVEERLSVAQILEPLFPVIDEICTDTSKETGCCVHRDWHSQNLMVRSDDSIGILDFQDCLWGNPAYDLVSLTRDCYVRHRANAVFLWEEEFRKRYQTQISAEKWQIQCDAVALQRHLKVLGIFVRLAGEGKSNYLQYLPQVVSYALEEASRLHGKEVADLSVLIGVLARALPRVDK